MALNALARRPRKGLAVAAVLALVAALAGPVVIASSAVAEPAGYEGEASGNAGSGPWQDDFLSTMTAGVSYSDTVQLPVEAQCSGSISTENAPDGLDFDLNPDTGVISVTGTPSTAGEFSDFEITAHCTDGDTATLTFNGTVDSDKTSTSVDISGHAVDTPDSVEVIAQVSADEGTPTGLVQFYINGEPLGDPVALSGQFATLDTGISGSYIGSTATFTAEYLGDDNFADSTSDDWSDYIYSSNEASGTMTIDGAAVPDATVVLLDQASGVVATTTTDSDGHYDLGLTVLTEGDATARYVVRATVPDGTRLPEGTQLYYSIASAQASATDPRVATPAGPSNWSSEAPLDIYYNYAPTWTDSSIADPRQGAVYSDAVAASGTPIIHYIVSAGSLPSGLALGDTSGIISGTPFNDGPYDFTVRATNDFGFVDQELTGTIAVAHVPPTWTDSTIGDFQANVLFSDSVAASGDPTIGYAVTDGLLPAGIHLNAATGELTGTPTTAGAYDFTITASSDYGHVDQEFTGEVTAAPDLGLTLDFAAGTKLTDASTSNSGSGLQVDSTYTLTLHSHPIVLTTGTVDDSGNFSFSADLPADTPVGAHELILTGVAPDGRTLTAHAWFTLLSNGTIGAVSLTGPIAFTNADTLAFTGFTVASPLELGAGVLTLGVVLLLLRRRRRVA